MTIKLEHTGSQYQVDSPGGWRFKVQTFSNDNERGWESRVTVTALGLKEERAAIEHLRPALRALLRELDQEFGS